MATETERTDLSNRFVVSLTGSKKIAIGRAAGLPYGISPDDALLLAAWLVSVAQPFATLNFGDIIDEVQSS